MWNSSSGAAEEGMEGMEGIEGKQAVEGADPARAALVAALHGALLLVGVAGNAVLCACVCAQQSARMRNHLLLNVCVSDLLVCALGGSVAAAAAAAPGLAAAEPVCRAAAFLQSAPVAASTLALAALSLDRYAPGAVCRSAPVAASTLALAALSLDRYASVQHPRLLTQLRHRRHLAALLVGGSWGGALLAAALACCAECAPAWPPPGAARRALGACRVAAVWLGPAAAVAACHVAVGRKLCEVSLTAAAARGELPLPMPVIRRRRNVILVAGGVGVAGDGPSKVIPFHCGGDSSSDEEALALQICADLDELRRPPPAPPPRRPHRLRRLPACRGRGRARRASRSERAIVRANRRLRPLATPPLAKAGGGQTPAARRRLARLLYLQLCSFNPRFFKYIFTHEEMSIIYNCAAVFALCWLPHAACQLCELLAGDTDRAAARSLLPFTLLLGHAHSALHPLLYWLLNRQSPQLQGCAPFRWPRVRHPARLPQHGLFRLPAPRRRRNPPPSSTNEAALGVFHPRYTVPRPQERQRFPTSHFLP
ncbi:uncharacterized protein LOC134533373 [Bacillus rossius redtenbacheri]|uniref:uncharacterized protein LOC134533373 n=1 Tax=Bacillus rossius redtenbacheri TaxID=93214 RepID=UPI002FDDC824